MTTVAERQQSATGLTIEAMRVLVQRAWRTHAAIRDPDARYLATRSGWLMEVVHSASEAYGYAPPRVRLWQPTPADISAMDIVLSWMAWLRRCEGEGAVRRIMAWALSVPLWRLAQREQCSERTVLRRIDRSLARVMTALGEAAPAVPDGDEPLPGPVMAICVPSLPRIDGAAVPGLVHVEGRGRYRNGRRIEDGQDVALRRAKIRA